MHAICFLENEKIFFLQNFAMFEKQSDMTYLVRGNNSSGTKSVFLKLLRFMFASISFDSHLTVFKTKVDFTVFVLSSSDSV